MEVSRKREFHEDKMDSEDPGSVQSPARVSPTRILVDRSPLRQAEFHEMYEYVPKKNFLPFVGHHVQHNYQVSKSQW